MNNLTKIFFLFSIIEAFEFYNSTPSILWIARSLEKFESSIPIPHYQDTFDFLVDKNHYSLVFLTWYNDSDFLPNAFKLTVKSFDGRMQSKVCDIEAPSVHESSWIVPKSVTYLKIDRVLLYWKEGSKIHDTEGT